MDAAGGHRGAGLSRLCEAPAPDARIVLAGLIVAAALAGYVGGSVESWTVAGAFGQRRFVATTAVLTSAWRRCSRSRRAFDGGAGRLGVLFLGDVVEHRADGAVRRGLMDRQRLNLQRVSPTIRSSSCRARCPGWPGATCPTARASTSRDARRHALTRSAPRSCDLLYLADIRFPLERANGIQTFETCRALAARGHDVTLLVRPDTSVPARDPWSFYGAEPYLASPADRIDWSPGPTRRACYLTAACGRVMARSADVVFTRDLGAASWPCGFHARCARPALVYEAHGYAPAVSAELPRLLGTATAAVAGANCDGLRPAKRACGASPRATSRLTKAHRAELTRTVRAARQRGRRGGRDAPPTRRTSRRPPDGPPTGRIRGSPVSVERRGRPDRGACARRPAFTGSSSAASPENVTVEARGAGSRAWSGGPPGVHRLAAAADVAARQSRGVKSSRCPTCGARFPSATRRR